jgi:hypothetical protein
VEAVSCKLQARSKKQEAKSNKEEAIRVNKKSIAKTRAMLVNLQPFFYGRSLFAIRRKKQHMKKTRIRP